MQLYLLVRDSAIFFFKTLHVITILALVIKFGRNISMFLNPFSIYFCFFIYGWIYGHLLLIFLFVRFYLGSLVDFHIIFVSDDIHLDIVDISSIFRELCTIWLNGKDSNYFPYYFYQYYSYALDNIPAYFKSQVSSNQWPNKQPQY